MIEYMDVPRVGCIKYKLYSKLFTIPFKYLMSVCCFMSILDQKCDVQNLSSIRMIPKYIKYLHKKYNTIRFVFPRSLVTQVI